MFVQKSKLMNTINNNNNINIYINFPIIPKIYIVNLLINH